MRTAARVDTNQAEIVAAFRKFGCSVGLTHTVGKGFPDLVVAKNFKTVLVEVKDGQKVKSAQALTQDEKKFHGEWQGIVLIVTCLGDVIDAVRGLDK